MTFTGQHGHQHSARSARTAQTAGLRRRSALQRVGLTGAEHLVDASSSPSAACTAHGPSPGQAGSNRPWVINSAVAASTVTAGRWATAVSTGSKVAASGLGVFEGEATDPSTTQVAQMRGPTQEVSEVVGKSADVVPTNSPRSKQHAGVVGRLEIEAGDVHRARFALDLDASRANSCRRLPSTSAPTPSAAPVECRRSGARPRPAGRRRG